MAASYVSLLPVFESALILTCVKTELNRMV